MDTVTDLIAWFNADRTAVVVAMVALAGIIYSAQSARAAKRQAETANKQAEHADKQVELSRQQIELLLRQIKNSEEAEAANRRARRESLEPMVVVDIAPGVNDPGVFVLTISNVGPSIARNIRIKTPEEMIRSDGTKMHEWAVFTEDIKTMPPGHRLQFFYDVGFQPFKGNSPMKCTFVVDCEGPFGPVPQATYVIDLTPYEGAWAAPTTLSSVVKQLDTIAGAIKQMGKIVGEAQNASRAMTERSIVETSQMNNEWTTWKATD